MRCTGCGYTGNTARAEKCKLCGTEMGGGGAKPAHGAPATPTPAAESPTSAKAPPRGDWTRHMLIRAGGAPLDVLVGKPFTFGRATECQVSIPSQRVSRKHAEIVWKDGKPVLRDLGSQNGTQVNGRPVIGEHALVDQDELVVGPFSCTYRLVSGVGSVGLGQRVDGNAPTVAAMGDSLSGNLGVVGVVELLDALEWGKKSGTLEVFHPDGEQALLVLEQGAPRHAALGSASGTAAVLALLGWSEGLFRFGAEVDPAKAPNLRGETLAQLIAAGKARM